MNTCGPTLPGRQGRGSTQMEEAWDLFNLNGRLDTQILITDGTTWGLSVMKVQKNLVKFLIRRKHLHIILYVRIKF